MTPPPCPSYTQTNGNVPNQHGPYTDCILDKTVAYTYHTQIPTLELVQERVTMMPTLPNEAVWVQVGKHQQNVKLIIKLQLPHPTHVLCGCTTFGTKSN